MANSLILQQEPLLNSHQQPTMASPNLFLPLGKELPQALGAQHAPAPEADIAAPDPGARMAEREPAELQGRPRV